MVVFEIAIIAEVGQEQNTILQEIEVELTGDRGCEDNSHLPHYRRTHLEKDHLHSLRRSA